MGRHRRQRDFDADAQTDRQSTSSNGTASMEQDGGSATWPPPLLPFMRGVDKWSVRKGGGGGHTRHSSAMLDSGGLVAA
jgi:hypothetical protein